MNGSLHNFILYCKQAYEGLKHIKNLRLSDIRKAFSLMRKREKIAVTFLGTVAAITLLVSIRNIYLAMTVPVPAAGGSYTEGIVGQPAYINPLLATNEPDLSLLKLIFSGLYTYDTNGEIVPDLAESLPAISEDQKQYTIALKKNVQWHDNTHFTAEDVIFTYDVLKNAAYKSPYRPFWLTTSVEKINDYTVKFTTKDVSGPFLDNLTLPIISKSAWESEKAENFSGSSKNLYAMGTGPYAITKIKRFQPDGKVQEIDLRAFDAYFGEKAKIESVNFKFYDNQTDLLNSIHSKEIGGYGAIAGSLDEAVNPAKDGVTLYKAVIPQYQMVFFNTHGKILSEQPVRRALAMATDKQKIIDGTHEGLAAMPLWPIDSPATSTLTYDVEESKRILDQAGWVLDPATNLRAKKGVQLELTVSTNDYQPNARAAQELARQWQELGVKVNVNIVGSRQLADTVIKPRAFDALIYFEKFNADPDPFAFWHSTQSKDPGLNLSGFENAQADKLISEARNNTNALTREQKYKEFFQVLETEVPTIFLSQSQYWYAISSDIGNVNLGVLYDPSMRLQTLPSWYAEQKRVLR